MGGPRYRSQSTPPKVHLILGDPHFVLGGERCCSLSGLLPHVHGCQGLNPITVNEKLLDDRIFSDAHFPEDFSLQITPSLGPKVCRYYLHRSCMKFTSARSTARVFFTSRTDAAGSLKPRTLPRPPRTVV